MSIYESIKNIGRKCIAPAIVLTAMGTSGCNSTLPIYQTTVQKTQKENQEIIQYRIERLKQRRETADNLVKTTRENFNNYLADDRIFSIKEQLVIFNNYTLAESIYQEVKTEAKKLGIKHPNKDKLSKEDKRLKKLIRENLEKKESELEEKLRKQGVLVTVEKPF
jgi:methylthioribose-1-phosphate isomerase